jgi:hypothetical protein
MIKDPQTKELSHQDKNNSSFSKQQSLRFWAKKRRLFVKLQNVKSWGHWPRNPFYLYVSTNVFGSGEATAACALRILDLNSTNYAADFSFTSFQICSLRHRIQTDSGPTQSPTRKAPEALTPKVKRPGREADHSPPSSAVVKKAWSYTSTPQ